MSHDHAKNFIRIYRIASLGAAAMFAAVGSVFLFFPDVPLIFFNGMSGSFGLQAAPLNGGGFYLALAAAYMYIVTLIAVMMWRDPLQPLYPMMLANAKFASSAASLYLFAVCGRYLIFFANFIVDGFIGVLAVYFFLKVRKGV